CEVLFCDDIPDGVAINEAVEIAKKYSTAEDASFINGVLGSVARKKAK
ncbi:MAG: transcription antitermination factor NusB, partial [Ruminococcus sp.]|nr:transcription antitermination factor NusB [Ruminococcus sp.]